MSDDLNPTEEVEEAPAGVEESPSDDPADEQDVGALKRALDREREERRAAKEELRRIREDEDARREFLAELGYEIADPTEDQDDDSDDDEYADDPGHDPRVDSLIQWQQEREHERRLQMFNDDLSEVAGEREVSGPARDWIAYQTARTGDNRKALEKAVKDWFDYEDKLRSAGRLDYKESKKAPHVSQVGKSATKTPDLDDDEQRVAWMTEQAEARAASS